MTEWNRRSASLYRGLRVNAPAERPQVYRFGVFELDTLTHELRKQGVRVRLQDQPYQLLLLLLERAGRLVTRDELRARLWPSSVYVDFDHGLNNAIARVREALGDAAATPTFIETVPRLGYRFVHPILSSSSPEVAPAALDEPHDAANDAALRQEAHRVADIKRSIDFRIVSIAAAAVAIGALALIVYLRPPAFSSNEPSTPTSVSSAPSIAVLPFVNMSPDKDSEYFADGLSEELLSKLALIQGLKVASRTSSFHFKGKNEPAAVIAETLQVDHLLEGSVRRSGRRVRITAQLIDARDGYHRWSQTFDRELTDIFQIQEDIAFAVANALQVKLLASEEKRLRTRGTSDPEAYRHYLIARAHISWLYGRPDWNVIKRSYQEAIARDPQFAAPYAGLAHYYYNREFDEAGVKLGEAAAERAVELDPDLSEALGALANFEARRYHQLGDFEAVQRAQKNFRRALELDPTNAQATFHYARAVMWHEPALAVDLFERTVQLDPIRYTAIGLRALLMSGQGMHDAAYELVKQLYERNPGQRFHNAIHMATLEYYRGNLDRATAFMHEALARGDVSSIPLWALHMSLGDPDAARETPVTTPSDKLLREAASMTSQGDYARAFALLDRRRLEFPNTRILDIPAARLALIVGRADRAREILEQRLPDLARGIEPIDAFNVLPAIDLAIAWADEERARSLLGRVAAFLDGPDAPQWSMFVFERARVHALAGEIELAHQSLDRAYAAGFRTIWSVDLLPAPFFYIDGVEVDPAFRALRDDPRFARWLERIESDNALKLERLRAHDARRPSA